MSRCSGVGLFASTQGEPRHAAAHVLVTNRAWQQPAAVGPAAGLQRELTLHVVFDERENFPHVFVFVVVGVHVDDQDVIEAPSAGLLARMGEQPRRIQLVDRNSTVSIGDHFHGFFLSRAAAAHTMT